MHTLFFYLLHTVLDSQCEVALQCASTTRRLPIHTRAGTKVTLQDPQLYEVKQTTP